MKASFLRRLGSGLLAGALAGLAFTLVALLLRLIAGLPLIAEVTGDRLIPTLDVRTFIRLLGRVGGPLRGKSLGFTLSLLSQVGIGALLGMVFGLMFGPRSRPSPRAGAAIRPAATPVLIALVGTGWLVGVVLLWPALASNYAGLPSPWARITTTLGLALEFATFAWVLLASHRWLLRTPVLREAPATEPSDRERDEPDEPARRVLSRTPTVGRRAVLLGGAGVVAAAASGGFAGALYRRATFGAFGYDGLMLRGPHTVPITPNADFYCVTKNLIDPRVSTAVWRLSVGGLVDRPITYGFGDLRALPAVHQVQTLECISNGVGSGLMSNAEWTGVTLRSLIEAAGPRPGIARVVIHGVDGFVSTISMDQALEPTTIVAYAMNGEPLPHRHGYPARVLVPGTYGEINVKWVDGIELSASPVEGYYERQGWKPDFVQTSCRFDRPVSGDTISLANTPVMSLGGVAFAGDRGISEVEWSADGGSVWQSGRISYAPSKISWALWEATWSPPGPGDYRLVVRATDGGGTLQPNVRHGVVPAGSSGWHEVAVTVRA